MVHITEIILTYCGRIAVIFYCLGTMDILTALQSQSNEHVRETWRDWLWEQQVCSSILRLLFATVPKTIGDA